MSVSVIQPVPQHVLEQTVRGALAEDNPRGDITADSLFSPEVAATAVLVAREAGVVAGLPAFQTAMVATDPAITVETHVTDGDPFNAGDTLATVRGPARGVLTAERVALNLVQRLSAIATATTEFVARVRDTKARIVDTRKTTPGLRALERYAVRCGGGFNHRDSLSDAVMVKDNHIALLGEGAELTAALVTLRQRVGHTVHIEVEVDRLDQIEAVLRAGADTIMLDNFSIADLRAGVELVGGRAIVEASGNVNLDTVADIAKTGVDVISAGALTHSVKALDLGLDFLLNE